MFDEAAESGAVVQRQRDANRTALVALGERLRTRRPCAVATLARGSSDNAATFARYLIETRLGVLTSSVPPSVASVYNAAPDMAEMVMLAISQSGQSPDLVSGLAAARARGAYGIALTNAETSPLAAGADLSLPLHAGPERSVAATKSFVASLAAILDLVAHWSNDTSLACVLDTLPDALGRAWDCDWGAALGPLDRATSLYVVGRGPGYGIAQEAALKLKETCGLHAEAFSAAEVRHGPMALVGKGFPVLLFAQDDATRPSVAALAQEFAARGATLFHAGLGDAPGMALPVLDADPAIQPLLMIESFYRLANALALARGHDPDSPPHLAKVTETV
ncbi:SIS domain-containing protein [Hephaestia sp. GCM10023244]|uniref:SIS domain-containing protein n=1 Tax=unclassified Hephaestia TaxID=2631281 RepID=UPI0020770E07|nr:SIS domain-containing protein [Hephaestia sp. MAHUQ-44]MCM8731216.1 SIS domain-containing protein [Hephaestia sp. MAHUQ-44]